MNRKKNSTRIRKLSEAEIEAMTVRTRIKDPARRVADLEKILRKVPKFPGAGDMVLKIRGSR